MPALNRRQKQPLSALFYSAIGGLFLSFFMLILTGVFVGAGGPAALVPLFSFVILVVLLYPAIYWYLFTYELSEHTITTNSGVIFRQYETIDFDRIQVVDNERGPLLWLFGLTMVRVWTASTDQMDFSVSTGTLHSRPRPDMTILLAADDAHALKDFLMRPKAQRAPGL